MARISTYTADSTPVSSDKLIGTDSSGATTKNYPLGTVADWLKESGASAVLGQTNYKFQITLDPNEGRQPGSFSFSNYGGDGIEFIDVSRLVVSNLSSTGQYIGDYLLSTVGDRVMLAQLDDLNKFGVYRLVSLIENPVEPTFFDAELLFVEGNGALQGNKSYGLATYSASASAGSAIWGSIEGDVTNQTDLVEYIDAEIGAIPAPTLQTVTDEGNTTTNDITVNSIVANGTLQLSAYTAGLLQTDASGNVSLDTTSYSTFSGNYDDLTDKPYIPVSGTDFDPVGTDNSTNVTLLSVTENYLSISGQEITAGIVPISLGGTGAETAEDARSSLNVDEAGTDNSTNVTLAGTYDYLTLSGQEITLNQIDYSTDITNLPTLGTASASAATDFVAVTGDEMTGKLTINRGATNDPALNLTSNSSGWGSGVRFNNTIASTGKEFGIYSSSTGYLQFTKESDSYGTIMRFTPNNELELKGDNLLYTGGGNVGIGTTSPSYKLHVDGNVGITEYLQHSGDNNTYLRFSGDMVRLAAGGVEMIRLHEDATQDTLVINEGGTDVDFRVESDIDTHALFVQGSDGNVGIGAATPNQKLEVIGNVKVGDASADNYVQSIFSDGSETRMHGYGFYMSRTNSYIRPTNDGAQILAIGTDNHTWNYVAIDANYFTISTNASEHLRVTNAGNVGIGTTSPSEKLEITGSTATAGDTTLHLKLPIGNITAGTTEMGNILFSSSDASAGGTGSVAKISTIAGDGTSAWVGAGRPTDMAFFTQPIGASATLVEAMRINQDGNVGIGLSSPSYKLEVAGGGDNVIAGFSSTDNRASILIQDNDTASYIGSEGGLLYFNRGTGNGIASAPSNGMVINSSGNVGIGTTSPVGKLHVHGQDNSIYSVFARSDARWMYLHSGTNDPAIGWNTGGNMRFGTATSNVGVGFTERMRITSGGNVGIGTTNPLDPLNVQSTGASDYAFRIFRSTSTTQGLAGFYEGSANQGQLYLLKGDNTAGVLLNSSGDSFLNGGNVGIGTTSPSKKLHVNGSYKLGTNAYIQYDATYPYTINIQNTASAGDIKLQSANGENKILLQPSTGGIDFYTNTSERMRITDGGNVGIGTTSPGAKLTILGGALGNLPNNALGMSTGLATGRLVGNYGVNLACIYNEYNDDTIEISAGQSSGYVSGMVIAPRAATGDVIDAVTLYTRSAERMRITSAGNVGIGTTSPQAKFHAIGHTMFSGGAYQNGYNTQNGLVIDSGNVTSASGAYGAGIEFTRLGDSTIKKAGIVPVQETADSDSIGLSFHTARTTTTTDPTYEAMRLTHDSKVGIGESAPASKLEVKGPAMSQFRMQTAGGPSGTSDTSGGEGDFAYDDLYLYIKTGSGWGRVALDFAF